MSAYVIIHNRITDPGAMEKYIPTASEAIFANGGELLVLEEDSEVLEGSTDLPRTIVVGFESREKAEAFYNSAEYQSILPVRLAATEGYAVIVDGFEMPG